MPIPQMSDTIYLSNPTAGDANAGNGGDGHNHGNIDFHPVAYIDPTQKVYGADTDLHNGDHVWQKADWDAGNAGDGGFAQAKNGFLAAVTNSGDGGAGGDSHSNGNQGNSSGGDTATVSAATTATQHTQLMAEQNATILAGVGGNGGDDNMARGGEITSILMHTNPETTTVNNAFDHFVNTFGDIDLSHLGS